MLRIKTYVAQSSIAGLGLFAAESVRKGSAVWVYDKLFDISFQRSWFELDMSISETVREYINNYAYLDIKRDIYSMRR